MALHQEQGEGGATRTRRSGSHLEQGEGGAGSKGPSIPQKGGNIPPVVPASQTIQGSHLTPHPTQTDQTAVRGGGTVSGHDRTNPNLGKAHSGDKETQHPSLNSPGRQAPAKYLS